MPFSLFDAASFLRDAKAARDLPRVPIADALRCLRSRYRPAVQFQKFDAAPPPIEAAPVVIDSSEVR